MVDVPLVAPGGRMVQSNHHGGHQPPRQGLSLGQITVISSSARSAFGKGFAGRRLEISLQRASGRFLPDGNVRAKGCRQVFAGGGNTTLLMRGKTAAKIVCRADIDVAVAELDEIDVPHAIWSPCAPTELRETPFALAISACALPPVARQGEGWRRGWDSNP